MANKKIWLGMLAMALVFGMTVVGCDDDSTSGGGTFTLTNIPSEYNGKYARFGGGNEDIYLVGAQSINTSTGTVTYSRISNGSVSIPVWNYKDDGYTVERYFGNHTVELDVYITNSASFTREDVEITSIVFESVTFSKGNATKSWNDGEIE